MPGPPKGRVNSGRLRELLCHRGCINVCSYKVRTITVYLTGTQTFTFTPVDPMSAPSKAQKVRTPKLTVEGAFAPVTNRHGRFFWACGGAAGHRPRVQRVAIRPLYMRLLVALHHSYSTLTVEA